MGMAVNQTGDSDHAGTVNDGCGHFLGRLLGDREDLTVFNADISTEEHLHFFIHRHRSDIGNQSVQDVHFLSNK